MGARHREAGEQRRIDRVVVGFEVPRHWHAALKLRAELERRSVSDLLRRVVAQYLTPPRTAEHEDDHAA